MVGARGVSVRILVAVASWMFALVACRSGGTEADPLNLGSLQLEGHFVADRIELWWTPVTGASWYVVYEGEVGTGSTTVTVEQVARVREAGWLDPTFAPGRRYLYRVGALNEVGELVALSNGVEVATPPDPGPIAITLLEHPPAVTRISVATWRFAPSTTIDVSILCRIDDGPEVPCRSPVTTQVLGEGAHTFTITPVHPYGGTVTPAGWTWWLDTLPPVARIRSGPSGSLPVGRVDLELACDDASPCALWCRLDGGAPVACDATWSIEVAVAGPHTLAVTAVDAAGNLSATAAEATWIAVAGSPFAGAAATVAVGYDHACVIDLEGALWCWGSGLFGKLGVGAAVDLTTPTLVGGAGHWRSVALGRHHTCGVGVDGSLWCWGNDSYGQLGDGNSGVAEVLWPLQVGQGTQWVRVTAGAWHTCALAVDGTVYCWGYGADGRLGDGTDQDRTLPTPVAAATRYTDLGAGAAANCAVTDTALDCWGRSLLGDAPARRPRTVTGGSWTQVVVGAVHACALATDGSLSCWGDGGGGVLGLGDVPEAAVPATPVSGGPWRDLSIGAYHTCAVANDGSLWCWGDDLYGQVGYGGSVSTPAEVQPGTDWRSVSAGDIATCAVSADTSVWCWGSGTILGEAGREPVTRPIRVE